jgi:hypothetical protein
MNLEPFQRHEHVYRSAVFTELIQDAIGFFEAIPVYQLPLQNTFFGTGVYALYYTGSFELYQPIRMTHYDLPIYVGKAVPRGWRQARTTGQEARELYQRLREHERSLEQVNNLTTTDFSCRFMIFEDVATDMIGTVEATLIKRYHPLWNTVLDGFGNHDPGKGRYAQAKSDWDVLHVGRLWAEKCNGTASNESEIRQKVQQHLKEKADAFA